MDTVIIVTHSQYEQVMRTEVYSGDTDSEELLDYLEDLKGIYGHSPIAREETYVAFSDGSRAELIMYEVEDLADAYRTAEYKRARLQESR